MGDISGSSQFHYCLSVRLKWFSSLADEAEMLSPLQNSSCILSFAAIAVVILIDGSMLAQECQGCRVIDAEQHQRQTGA